MSLKEEKLRKGEQVSKSPGFLKRNRLYFLSFSGFILLHIGWYKVVETHVPEQQKPMNFPFTVMRKLDPFRTE